MSNHTVQLKTDPLTSLKKEWHQLFSHAAYISPFLSYEWFCALDRHLLRASSTILTFRRANKLIGIAPVEIADDTLVFIADKRVTDFCDIMYDPEYKQDVFATLGSMIMRDDLRVRLFPIEPTSPLAQLLPEYVTDIKVERGDVCPFIRLPESWEAYLGRINGKLRHELRRKLRKAATTTISCLPGNNLGVLFDLMAASDASKRQFLTPDVRDFFRDIASAFDGMGWLRLRGTFLSGKPISVLFSFQLKQTVFLFNSGFDPEAAHLSPGIVSICQDIQSAIGEKITCYDFLRGDEEYKYRFGAEDRATVRLVR